MYKIKAKTVSWDGDYIKPIPIEDLNRLREKYDMEVKLNPEYFKSREAQYDQALRSEADEYVIVRVDGRSFHTFTRDFQRPFDSKFTYAMNYVAKKLKETFNADLAYVQSDEISLGWSPDSWFRNQIFGGRLNKINSIVASTASVLFKDIYSENHAVFDCRTFTLKDLNEYRAYFMWRYRDCYKNAITMIAQTLFPHSKLHEKNTEDKIYMIGSKGVDIKKIEKRNLHGAMFFSTVTEKVLSVEEIDSLPPKHEARKNPDMVFYRNVTNVFIGEMKIFLQSKKI